MLIASLTKHNENSTEFTVPYGNFRSRRLQAREFDRLQSASVTAVFSLFLFLYIVPRLAINAVLTNPILRVRPFQRNSECFQGRTKYISRIKRDQKMYTLILFVCMHLTIL